MGTVGSTSRVDGVDLQMMVNAAAFAQPQSPAAASAHAQDDESDARISSAGKLRSAASAVLDAAGRLSRTQTWQATKASSDNEALVQAVSDKAAPGRYAVQVDAVATAQTTSSPTFSSLGTLVGIGTLKIEMGGWNSSQSTFATNPNWPKANVTLGPKDTSMEEIRDRINAAGVGVIATVVSDATGSRLVLRSTSTGASNGFKAQGQAPAETDAQTAQALASLGFDPTSAQGTGQLVQAGQDAKLRIDGRAVQSPQNLIEDEASGLTLRLRGQQGGSATIQVEADTDAMTQDIQSFADAYNDMVSQLQQAPSPSAAGGATDSGTRTAQAIQQRLEEAFSNSARAGALGGQLKAIGIEMNTSGRLDIDTDRLGEALSASPARVEQLFDASGNGKQATGLAARLLDLHLPESETAATQPATLFSAGATASAPTAAGAQFRQRLLDQYKASANQDDEAAISANAA